ncbi:MAG: Stealth CR1 domain-containing protein [Victivallales bacterium]|nr:Stealth CR1 domain-containing protein [Victivallales bacterium]
MSFDIDIVLPWVDGSDPAWQAEKAKYSPVKVTDANAACRYKDWGYLPFLFRGFEKFMPWIHKIHFLTWGHLPNFLNTDHPKLHIVRHEDFIPEQYRPVFSSNAIEVHLHRIPELAERFIYFNDDTFPLRPLPPETFFANKTGLPCLQFTEYPLILENFESWNYRQLNDVCIINRHFPKRNFFRHNWRKCVLPSYGLRNNLLTLSLQFLYPERFAGFRRFHSVNPFLKSILEEVWEKEPKILEQTAGSRFRSKDSVNQWLFLWWQLAKGTFHPRADRSRAYNVCEYRINLIEKTIREQTSEILALQDPFDTEEDLDALNQRVLHAFTQILPEKSSFEK